MAAAQTWRLLEPRVASPALASERAALLQPTIARRLPQLRHPPQCPGRGGVRQPSPRTLRKSGQIEPRRYCHPAGHIQASLADAKRLTPRVKVWKLGIGVGVAACLVLAIASRRLLAQPREARSRRQ